MNQTSKIMIFVALFSVLFFVEPTLPQKSLADNHEIKQIQSTGKKYDVIVTAYSSTPEETDSTPFITASGKLVREGIIATNILPMGTKVRIPELFGNKIFVVEDRMHPRKKYVVDIWFPTKKEAINFGAKRAFIEVLK